MQSMCRKQIAQFTKQTFLEPERHVKSISLFAVFHPVFPLPTHHFYHGKCKQQNTCGVCITPVGLYFRNDRFDLTKEM